MAAYLLAVRVENVDLKRTILGMENSSEQSPTSNSWTQLVSRKRGKSSGHSEENVTSCVEISQVIPSVSLKKLYQSESTCSESDSLYDETKSCSQHPREWENSTGIRVTDVHNCSLTSAIKKRNRRVKQVKHTPTVEDSILRFSRLRVSNDFGKYQIL